MVIGKGGRNQHCGKSIQLKIARPKLGVDN